MSTIVAADIGQHHKVRIGKPTGIVTLHLYTSNFISGGCDIPFEREAG